MKNTVTARQHFAMGALCTVAASLRALPVFSAMYGGNLGYMAVLAAGGIFWLYLELLLYVMRKKAISSLGDVFSGKTGRGILIMYSILFLVFAALTVGACSNRLCSTVFEMDDTSFLCFMVSLCAGVIASGEMRHGARWWEIVLGIALALGAVLLFLSFKDVKWEYYRPGETSSVTGLLKAAAATFPMMAPMVYRYFLPKTGPEKKGGILYIIVTMGLICFLTVGTLSAPLTALMTDPVFVMVRNVTAFGMRLEAVLVTVWVLLDSASAVIYMKLWGHTVKKAALNIKKEHYCAAAATVFLSSAAIGKNAGLILQAGKIFFLWGNIFAVFFLTAAVFFKRRNR